MIEIPTNGPFTRQLEITTNGPFKRELEIPSYSPFKRELEIPSYGPFTREFEIVTNSLLITRVIIPLYGSYIGKLANGSYQL